AQAGAPAPKETMVHQQPNNEPFARGAKEFQELAGGFRFFQFHNTNNDYPSIDYAIDTLRLGVMLNDPRGHGLFAGNFEFLGEVFGGGIVQGPGDGIAGATLIFRYNFVQPGARFVPYFQIGAGGVYTDIGEKESVGQISLPVEFNLQGIGGLRYFLNDRWSLIGEIGYRHISNAGLHNPNVGVDSIGGNVGVGFSF
ncbi:MAG: acyloxyacyl hydrolase, partial [Rhodanobacteraceae bacterium]